MATSSLLKSLLHKSIADGLFKEVVSRTSKYYYFLGKTLTWTDEASPPYPIDSFQYEKDTRNEIITLKQIKPSDVGFVIPRINWISGTVYDIYDDQYSTEVRGLDISNGGGGYTAVPTVTISAPNLATGTQATATVSLFNGEIIDSIMTNNGSGYTTAPTVTLSGGGLGSGAVLTATIVKAPSTVQKLEDAQFYVMTDEYNVYKCLDNNNNAQSVNKPIGTQVLPISLADGYVWKYMYNVPIALRTKFLTDDQMPVLTALTQQFYSAGGIENVDILNTGTGYTGATLIVSGDGYLESDPVYLSSVNITSRGLSYADGDTITIADPFVTLGDWTASTAVFLGNKYRYAGNIYEVSRAGTTGTSSPSHRSGIVANGTAALKFLGTTVTAYPSFNSTTVSGVAISGTAGQFTCSNASLAVGDRIKITGTFGGTGSISGYVTGNVYKISSITGTSPSVTGFTLQTTSDSPIVTTAGTPTGLTYAASGISAVNLLGGVREVNLTSFGSGYNSNPIITFSYPGKTFDPATALNTSTETITLGSHWYSNGDAVVYTAGTGGTAIGGLVDNTTYYVIKASSTTIRLALTYANAIDGTPINLSSGASGTSHRIVNSSNYATGFAEISPTGSVKRIRITDSGINYPEAPIVHVGSGWTASTAVTLGQQYYVSNRLYTVTTAGTTHASAGPTGSVLGTQYTNGTAGFTYVGSPATGTAVLRYGAGYDSNPLITINTTTGTGFSGSFLSIKTEAKLIPIIDTNGQITSVQVDDAGVGYSAASITVSGDGDDAEVSPDISIGNINTLQANNELLTVSGTINNIQLISGGYNYGVATITINGDGTGATAVATLSGGKITKITMTNQGSDYTYADVVITGNGQAAKARAIISPYKGHGKDAFSELFARTLMFYSNVSKDKNQGFDVNNDYRQVGLIKNPIVFDGDERFSANLGSACYAIEGNINTTNFQKDMLLTTPRTVGGVVFQRRFRIVSVASTGALIQSLDNEVPVVADVMTNENSQFFSVSAVNAPTVDKYSGDLLFIDNKSGFTPSADETVTLRTVIRF
jgi:hypothetical protein